VYYEEDPNPNTKSPKSENKSKIKVIKEPRERLK
jgi:hypothetical protein